MNVRLQRKFGGVSSVYVSAGSVYVDIPLEMFISEYEFQKSRGLSSEKALEICKSLCREEIIKVAHQVPVGA